MTSTVEFLKQELGTTVLKSTGGGGGCISEGTTYETDSGKVFVKFNQKPDAMLMFEGEYHSLKAIVATATVKAPKPIKVLKDPKGGAMLVMENLDMRGLRKHEAKLGEHMAKLHLHNSLLKSKTEKTQQSVHKNTSDETDGETGLCNQYVAQFGFSVPTSCGYISQDNLWNDSWPDFYARKIDVNIKRAQEKYGDREAGQVWSTLLPNIPKLFTDVTIEPALMHGDLWAGNAGEVDEDPVVFDPASFYGHSEFDLAISTMFGGFGRNYFSSYHSLIPKQKGFDDRQDLYCMFHYLNHWNHFGGGYKSSTLSLLRSLAKKYS